MNKLLIASGDPKITQAILFRKGYVWQCHGHRRVRDYDYVNYVIYLEHGLIATVHKKKSNPVKTVEDIPEFNGNKWWDK